MTSPLTALIVAALRDPEVVAALREAVGVSQVADPWMTDEQAAVYLAIGEKHSHVIRDARRRGELAHGRAGRIAITRRSTLDAWALRRAKVMPIKPLAKVDDERAEARAAIEQASVRARKGA